MLASLRPLFLAIPLLTACVDPPAIQTSDAFAGTRLVAAGDIACRPESKTTRNVCRMNDTALLIEEIAPQAVLVLGDAQYASGTLDEFMGSYHPTWGRFRSITYPIPGNHEYLTPGAAGYFAYFTGRPGTREQPWYAFELNGWRLYALDSNCQEVGGCGEDSRQYRWLKSELAANDALCSLAFWHHARFSSGAHGGSSSMSDIWRLLDRAGVDVALSGHDHHYERFAPMKADGTPDPNGVRQFVVGTGGSRHYPAWRRAAGSEAAHSGAFGVLELSLGEMGYSWRFVPVTGSSYRDAGAAACR